MDFFSLFYIEVFKVRFVDDSGTSQMDLYLALKVFYVSGSFLEEEQIVDIGFKLRRKASAMVLYPGVFVLGEGSHCLGWKNPTMALVALQPVLGTGAFGANGSCFEGVIRIAGEAKVFKALVAGEIEIDKKPFSWFNGDCFLDRSVHDVQVFL